jgi:hypothetical protein
MSMRALVLAVALVAGGCAPSPAPMAATQASEILAQFAAGAAPVDICTPRGRAALRGAVRSYGAEMNAAGVAWPASPATGIDPDDLSAVDVAVLTAYAAGFVEASDLRGRARGASAFERWPELDGLRNAARHACAEVVELQVAATRFVLEAERYRSVIARADSDAHAAERIERQARLVALAESRLQMMQAELSARMAWAAEG